MEIDSDNLRALPNSSLFSDLMTKTLSSLMSSSNSLETKSSLSGALILGVPFYSLGVGKLKIPDKDYELTPELYKPLSYTGYTGKTMKNENDNLMTKITKRDLGYTGFGDRQPNRETFFTMTLLKLVEKIQNKTFVEITDDSDDLQGERLKKLLYPLTWFDN